MRGGNLTNKTWLACEVKELRNGLESGKDLDKIAASLGRSRHAIRQYANRLGYKFRHAYATELDESKWRDECVAGNDRFIQAMEAAGYKLVRPRKTRLNAAGSTR